jgi:hypothetical protein
VSVHKRPVGKQEFGLLDGCHGLDALDEDLSAPTFTLRPWYSGAVQKRFGQRDACGRLEITALIGGDHRVADGVSQRHFRDFVWVARRISDTRK